MPFYAVKIGKNPGVYNSWKECEINIKGYENAVYKKFESEEEAKLFINPNIKRKVDIASLINSVKKNQEEQTRLIKSQIPVNNQVVEDNYDFSQSINIYTDGSCINSGEDNSIGSIGVYFGEKDKRNESRKITTNKENKMTKARAELKAVLVGLSKVINDVVEKGIQVVVHTDSYYAIKSFTTDTIGKKSPNEFMNYDYVKKGFEIIHQYPNIKFHYQKHDLNSRTEHCVKLGISKRLSIYPLLGDLEDLEFKFGKYKNERFGDVYEQDQDYFDWCLLNSQAQINEIKMFLDSKND